MRKFAWIILLASGGVGSLLDRTGAFFADVGTTTAVFAAAADWHAPTSTVLPLSAYQTDTSFVVDYTATDGETGLDYVALYYRRGTAGPFTLFATHDYSGEPAVSGSFSFVAVEGDGVYEFYALSADEYGNVGLPPATPDESIILDTVAPTTVLTTSTGIVVDETVGNGGFTNGLSNGWSWTGSVTRLSVEALDTDGDGVSDLVVLPPSGGGSMARVGDSEESAGASSGNSVWDNRLTQTVARTDSYLSFYWRVVSFDAGEAPAAVVMANDTEVLRVSGADISTGGYPNDSGWQRAFVDLSGFSDEQVELKFYAGNTDPFLADQSWLYLDEVTTGRPAVNAAGGVVLSGSDAGGVAEITYSLDGGVSWVSVAGSTLALSGSQMASGVNELLYFSSDAAGNDEEVPAHPTEVILDDQAPDLPEELIASGISEHEVRLEWVAPADLGYFSRAAFYRLRASTTQLTAESFLTSGFPIPNVSAPAAAGQQQMFTVTGLTSGTAYWFGLAACDPVANCSAPTIVGAETLSEHEADPGDVVINELMWMGMSGIPGDEWLELRNMTDQPINLSGWQLTKKRTSDGDEVIMYTVPTGTVIAAHGHLLIAEFDAAHSALGAEPDLVVGTGSDDNTDFALANSDLQVRLYDGDFTTVGWLIDAADDGTGVPMAGLDEAGSGSVWYSMERNATPGDGTQASSWHTTLADTSEYFDLQATAVQGTPGAANQSQAELQLIPVVTLTLTVSAESAQELGEPVASASSEVNHALP